ncbi:hypothetical protein ASG43_09420 [Aureimonas sp. Leaf454]|uniref:hypothetical protein n=1 Tax=Aureimonas sp. Leaf454 TaxID=1736381 RepID=UPI000713C895|nr:hypothetical protein [Aureimonas sp. Leaf454]KQT47341.1 hypothetical protein ASG43_09420 [Aureimonas sp. Leaf454]
MPNRLPLSSQRPEAVVQIKRATLADLYRWEASATAGAPVSAYLDDIHGEMDRRAAAQTDRRFWVVARAVIWIGAMAVLTLGFAIYALPRSRW